MREDTNSGETGRLKEVLILKRQVGLDEVPILERQAG